MENTKPEDSFDHYPSVDWVKNITTDRLKSVELQNLESESLFGVPFFYSSWESIKTWLLLCIVGVFTGLASVYVNLATTWLSDLREGICTDTFYLNRDFCCWQSQGDDCTAWNRWTEYVPAYWLRPLAGFLTYLGQSIFFAALAVWLIKSFAPLAIGNGIPEIRTILAGYQIRGILQPEVLLVKSSCLILATGSGLGIGRESSLIHLACCVGDLVSSWTKEFAENQARRMEILTAATAAGVTVAFGAPIGGVLFTLEELAYYFPYKTMWRSFFCAMAAAVTLQMMNPFRTGRLVRFQVIYDQDWHTVDLFFYIFLGVLGGVFGAFFNRTILAIHYVRSTSAWCKRNAILEVAVVTAITALISYKNIFMIVDTSELLSYLFRECKEGDFEGLCTREHFGSTAALVLLTGLAKIFVSLMTAGLTIPLGYYIPSMAVGACVGRALGMLVQSWRLAYPTFFLFASCPADKQCITPGTYALVGAAAALGGVTRMTVSLVVIMFELTGALNYILPIMITVTVSKWVGDYLKPGGLDADLAKQRGYPYLDNRRHQTGHDDSGQRNQLYLSSESEAFFTSTKDMTMLTNTGFTLGDLEHLVQSTHYYGYPLVSSFRQCVLLGYVVRSDLIKSLELVSKEFGEEAACVFSGRVKPGEVDLSKCVDLAPLTINSHYSVDMIVDMFSQMGMKVLLILRHGRLQGLVTRKDILRHVAKRNK